MKKFLIVAAIISARVTEHPATAQVATRGPLTSLQEVERIVGAPTRVTLSLIDVPGDEAFARLAEVSATQINLPQTANKENDLHKILVNIEAHEQPFWTVMDEVARQTQTAVRYGEQSLEIVDQKIERRISTAAYPIGERNMMAVPVTWLLWQRPLPNSPASDVITTWRQMRVEWRLDPKLIRLNSGSVPFRIRVAEVTGAHDDEEVRMGASSFSYALPAKPDLQVYETRRQVFDLFSSTRDGKFAKRIAVLRGSIHIPLVLKKEIWAFANPIGMESKSRTVGHDSYYLKSFRAIDGDYLAQIYRVINPAETVGGSTPRRAKIGLDDLRLEDAQGRAFSKSIIMGEHDKETGKYLMNVKFTRAVQGYETVGEPIRLLWALPTDVRTVEIPFEFRDLPLF